MAKKDYFLPEFYRGIAHRGIHDNKTVTENGLKAFSLAISNDTAFELDIHLTSDGKLLVCHDSELKRVTGKEGIIENLTFDEIRANYRLLDGEMLPSFQEVLDLNRERHIIVTELKVYEGNYKPLAKAAKAILKQIKDPKKIVLISFDPRALLLMGKRFSRSLLICKDKDWVWKLHNFFDGVDLEYSMAYEKRVINYHHHGGNVNVWTLEKEEDLVKIIPYVDTVTYQYLEPVKVKEALARKK